MYEGREGVPTHVVRAAVSPARRDPLAVGERARGLAALPPVPAGVDVVHHVVVVGLPQVQVVPVHPPDGSPPVSRHRDNS